jgi:large subunit ribosomal protein L18
MNKLQARKRRGLKTRKKIQELKMVRLCIHRTAQHTYAQIIDPSASKVIASASTLQADVKSQLTGHAANVQAATVVGKVIAEKAKAAGIETVAFDRSGFKFHGRVKAIADSAREHGLTI